MAETDKLSVLASILPEIDPEDVVSEEDAVVQYEFIQLLNSIGSSDFKEVYMNMIDDIRQQSVQDQVELCVTIFKKIKEEYDFELPMYAEIENKKGANEVYQFIAFLEYDHFDFFGKLWNGLNVDLRKLNIKKFCESNADEVINQVEIQLKTQNSNQLVNLFLRTYNKEQMLGFIVEKTEKSRMMILLTMLAPDV